MKNKNLSEGKSSDLTMSQNMLCGSSAGMVSWVATYPLEVIRNRMMSGIFDTRGSFEITRSMYAAGGFRAFFKGLKPTLLRCIPHDAAMFTTYDVLRRSFDRFSLSPAAAPTAFSEWD